LARTKGGDNYSSLSDERKVNLKKAVSQGSKNFWTNLSAEDKADIIARRVETFKNRYAQLSEEQRQEWYEKASNAQCAFYQTEKGKESLKKKIDKGVKTKNNWTPQKRAEFGSRVSKTRNSFSEEKWADISKRESESQKAVWNKLTKEEKAEKLALARKQVKKVVFIDKDNKEIKADSSWEVSAYKLLQKLGVGFKYANLIKDKCWLDLNSRIWFPDFILTYRNLIIEVKGYYPAKVIFNEKILPAFLTSKHAEKFSIALCEFNPNIDRYNSLNDFLADLTWVHVAPKHKVKYEKFVKLSSSPNYRKRRT